MSANASLTQMQLLGVASEINVAEGYPRYEPSPSQAEILGRLPEIMEHARRTPYPVLEAHAQRQFLGALGQHSAPIGSGRLLSFYSSTVAIDVAAAALARRATVVGLVHPVIDCIPALLRSRGLTVVPVSEKSIKNGSVLEEHPEIQALFAANPNNPTGTVLSASEIRRLGRVCAEADVPLIIDQCFRAFDSRVQFDTYDVLDRTGVPYVIVEDTGKLWPTAGVKLGFLAWSRTCTLALAEVAADVLLIAPPFSVALVEEFARDMAGGGLERMQERIKDNRAILAGVLAGSSRIRVSDGASRVSVSRLALKGGMTGTTLWGQLLRRGVHAVPCRPFYWADPELGDRYLRIALSREPEIVQRAAEAVLECVERR